MTQQLKNNTGIPFGDHEINMVPSLCVYQLLGCDQLFVIPQTVVHLPILRSASTDPSVHGILQERLHEWVATPFSRGSSQSRDQTWVSSIADGFFTAEPPGKPYYIGVGSHSLLQGIFFTQGPNLGLPHCRQILYHLSQKADANNEASPTTLCPGGYYMLLPPLSPRVDLSLVF